MKNEFLLEENIKLSRGMPEIKSVISNVTDIKKISFDEIDSFEATGKKIAVKFKIKQKLLYETNSKEEPMCVLEKEFYYNRHIIVPKQVEGTNIEELVKNKYISAKAEIDNIYVNKLSKNSIHEAIKVTINATFNQTFEITFSTGKGIYLIYSDGSKKQKIMKTNNSNFSKPTWSPDGQKVAYINKSHKGDCIEINKVKAGRYFEKIFNFIWSKDGKEILFSATENHIKSIYVLNLETNKTKTIEKDKYGINNFSMRLGYDNKSIYLIREISSVENIWTMNRLSKEKNKITQCGYIKEFQCFNKSHFIAYCYSNGITEDEIHIFDLKNSSAKKLPTLGASYKIKSFNISPDDKYISLVAAYNSTDNLYIFDFKTNAYTNLTKTKNINSIDDFTWNMDSDKIYFSNNIGVISYIFCFSFETNECNKIYETECEKIELNYRPRIC